MKITKFELEKIISSGSSPHTIAAVLKVPLAKVYDWKNGLDFPDDDQICELRKLSSPWARLKRALFGKITPVFEKYFLLSSKSTLYPYQQDRGLITKYLATFRQNPDFLEVEEQAAARDEISKFFDQRTSVSINRMGVAPKLTRLSFFGLDINDFAQNAEPRRVSVHQARAGVILSYPSKTLVRDVAMNWNTFSEYAPFVRTIVLVGDADPAEHVFRVSQPSFSWSGDLIAARVEPVVAQTQSLDERAARPVLQKLLRNVYSAFEFGSDSEVYDALATSVQGELLREIYLQMKRSLVMAEQGGALSRVTDLEILDLLLVRNPDLAFDVTWRVTGTVEHWGHLHRRVNQYQATMSLSRDGGLWKLTGLQIRSEQRVKFDTGIRGYETGEKRVKKASTP